MGALKEILINQNENIIDIQNPQEKEVVDEFLLNKLNEISAILYNYKKNSTEEYTFESERCQRHVIDVFYNRQNFAQEFTPQETLDLFSRIKFVARTYFDYKTNNKDNLTQQQIYADIKNKINHWITPTLSLNNQKVAARKQKTNNDTKNNIEAEPKLEIKNTEETTEKTIENKTENNFDYLKKLIDETQGRVPQEDNQLFSLNDHKYFYRLKSDEEAIKKIKEMMPLASMNELLQDANVAVFLAKHQYRIQNKFASFHAKKQEILEKNKIASCILNNRARNVLVFGSLLTTTAIAGITAPAIIGGLLIGTLTYGTYKGIKKLANSIRNLINPQPPQPVIRSSLKPYDFSTYTAADLQELLNKTEITKEIQADNIVGDNVNKSTLENLKNIYTADYLRNNTDFFKFEANLKKAWAEFNRQNDTQPQPQKPKNNNNLNL